MGPALPPGRLVGLPGRGETLVRELPAPPGRPTLLLLHGWTVTADVNWGGCYPALEGRFGVVAPDLPGHGRGARLDGPFSLERCADDVVALAAACATEPVVAVGYSMGGPVSLLAARRHPGALAGLVLCATAARFVDPDPLAQLVSLGIAGVSLVARAAPEGLRKSVAEAVTRSRLEAAPGWILEQLRESDPVALVEAGLALRAFDATEWAPSLGLPSSVVVTEADLVVEPARQRRLAALLGNAPTFPVPLGHDAPVRSPDVFTPALTEACNRLGASHG